MPTMEINRVLENFNDLPLDEKEYVADLIKKQITEFRRERILQRAKEAGKDFKAGKVNRGTVHDLYRDLEDAGVEC